MELTTSKKWIIGGIVMVVVVVVVVVVITVIVCVYCIITKYCTGKQIISGNKDDSPPDSDLELDVKSPRRSMLPMKAVSRCFCSDTNRDKMCNKPVVFHNDNSGATTKVFI